MACPNKNVSEFSQAGYLHLPAAISHQDCQRLIFRMRELVHRKCHDDYSKVFQAGDDRQAIDDFFLASAQRISFFFDKNAPRLGPQGPHFQALNKVGHALHYLCPTYKKFSQQQKFYDLMIELGQKKPHLIQSMFIFKQPHFGDEVPPHQDATFIYTEPSSVIGLWFALENATIENGCLWVLPGGHRGPLRNRFIKNERNLNFAFSKRVDWPLKNYRPIEAKAGDMVVLHGHLPHFSERNRSSRTRFAYTLHFIDDTCHYAKSNWLTLPFS
jgi:phytanoyl-CoA hydroxylase